MDVVNDLDFLRAIMNIKYMITSRLLILGIQTTNQAIQAQEPSGGPCEDQKPSYKNGSLYSPELIAFIDK